MQAQKHHLSYTSKPTVNECFVLNDLAAVCDILVFIVMLYNLGAGMTAK